MNVFSVGLQYIEATSYTLNLCTNIIQVVWGSYQFFLITVLHSCIASRLRLPLVNYLELNVSQ